MSHDTEPRLQPSCPKCHRRHRPDLPCWKPNYSNKVTARVLLTQGTICWICGLDGATTVDHTPIARSHGGDDSMENTRPCHKRCNIARGNRRRLPEEPETRPTGLGISTRWRRV